MAAFFCKGGKQKKCNYQERMESSYLQFNGTEKSLMDKVVEQQM
jgi:hypothetical protein